MQSAPKRKMTTPGLGERIARSEKATIKEDEAVPVERQNISCPDALVPDALASKKTIRNPTTSTGTPAAKATTSSAPPNSAPASATQKRKRYSSRPSPVRVDDFGGAAMKIASRTRHSSAPRLTKARMDASKAPLDSQSAYVLSLIDGMITIEGLADITGIPVDGVSGIIERLERLGFVAAH